MFFESLSFWWLPELNAITFWIHNPAKLAEFRVVDFGINAAPFLSEDSKKLIEIVDTIVYHKG